MISLRKQLLICIGITTLFVGPHLLLHGTNIVTSTYQLAAYRMWKGISPYLDSRGGDWFKYSPLFALLYYPFSLLSSRPQAFFWGLLNLSVFWIGLSRLFRIEWKGTKESKWMLLAFVAASMELDGSCRYQQMNALLTGLCCWGVADFKKGNFIRAGVVLAFATNLKILPIAILLPLCLYSNSRFIAGAVGGMLAALFFPALRVGWSENLALLAEWRVLISKDVGASGILDVVTWVNQYGLFDAKVWVAIPIAVVSTAALFVLRRKGGNLELLLSMALLSVLLLSPRTESPTFVLVGPAYLALMAESLRASGKVRAGHLAVWVLGFFLITFCQNDLWPRKIWNPAPLHQFNKTMGVLVLWLFAIYRTKIRATA